MSTILVIEDNQDVRENLVEILELSGYTVHEAENGKVGVKKAQDFLPDLILCDIMMPVMDGYGVLYLLGKQNDTSAIPFIFLTAKADGIDVRKGMNEGADDYITKPYDEIELLRAIEKRLERKKVLSEINGSTKQGFQKAAELGQTITQIDDIFRNGRTNVYKAKETIFRTGNHAQFVYFLESGNVKQFRTNEDGKEFITKLIQAGDIFGFTAAINDDVYEDTTLALTDTSCLAISRDEFMKVLTAHPQIMQKLIKDMASTVSQDREKLISLAYNSVRKRVAHALIELSKNYPEGLKGDFFPANRGDISSMAGTANESVIRVMAEFNEDGFIEIKGRKIAIKRADDLMKMPF